MIDVGVLVNKINEMTCGEIREYMGRLGMRGEINDEHACVLANWIQKESGAFVGVGVHRIVSGLESFVVAVYDEYDDMEELANYSLSTGPREFIGAFDNSRFPELIVPIEIYE